jgi:LmbE family N-acetylglucosaminyl deacetylase
MRFRFLFFLPLAFAMVVRAQDPSPYFPERGAAALHQRSLDLIRPVMVLSLALEPGYEDLTTLAALRFGSGARFASAYATNGSATRSDLNGDPPSRVGARRREEAYRAVTRLGGEAFFLNFPDFGVVSGPTELDPSWRTDSLARSVADLLRSVKPDLVILPPDFRERGSASPRLRLLREALLAAVDTVGHRVQGMGGRQEQYPLVVRCAAELETGDLVPPAKPEERHRIWKRTPTEIAEEARGEYRSLRAQIAGWNIGRAGTYALLRGKSGITPRPLTDGLPVMGKQMTALASTVAQSVEKAGKEPRPGALATIAGTIRKIEKFFNERQLTLTGTERRVVLGWRVGLDNLRCSIMNVEITLVMPDTLMTERQLLFMRCAGIGGTASRDSVKIFFPAAMDGSWRINESPATAFPLKVLSEFRLLSQGELALDLPASVNGLGRPQARRKFPVVVFHEDRDWTRNYAYRRDFLLRAGPRRSMEMLTPVVRVTPGERLVLSLQNFSRDPYRGELTVRDSVVRDARAAVLLPTRDFVSLDTLGITWADTVAEGDHIVEVRAGKMVAGKFLARKFTAAADTMMKVGLLTGLEDSPVAETLRRMHVAAVAMDRIPGTIRHSGDPDLIVMDRDALSLRPDLRGRLGDLEAWVRAGGQLVILPQPEDRLAPGLSIGGIRFTGDPIRPATAPVVLEAGSRMLAAPNRITPEDFEGWIIARTLGGFILPGDADARVHVREAETGKPLAASLALGSGSITVTSLDLLPQMGIVHPGVFRLLGNMISSGKNGH